MRANYAWLVLGVVLLTACRGLDAPAGTGPSYELCCGGLGSCVPESLAPEELRARLGRGECQEALLCAPKAFIEDSSAVFDSCRTAGEQEGRCLPSCLPEVGENEQLTRGSCGENRLCVPCYDLQFGASYFNTQEICHALKYKESDGQYAI